MESYEQQLIDVAIRLFEQGAKEFDLECVTVAKKLADTIRHIHELYDAFQQSPRRTIEGSRGVAQRIGISRQGVHLRLRKLGLRVAEVIEPEVTFEELLKRSPYVQQLRMDMERKLAKTETETAVVVQ